MRGMTCVPPYPRDEANPRGHGAKSAFAHPTISYYDFLPDRPVKPGDDGAMCVDSNSHTPARGTRIEIYFSRAV
jgi:hypothetical protein